MNSSNAQSSNGGLKTLPRLSVVIASKDRHAMLERSVDAILRQTYPDFEVIVVDASSHPSAALIDNPRVKYHCLPEAPRNRNWQRNYGIARAGGSIAVLPDDDVLPREDWLANLASCYSDASVGGAGGRVIEGPDIPPTLPGGEAVATTTWWGEIHGNFRAVTDGPVDVDHLKGCNISFRLDILRRIGGYDERIDGWAMRDETDVCLRVRHEGYRLIYSPIAVVEHFGFSLWTTRDLRIEPPQTGYSGAKTMTYFVFKNLGRKAGTAWVAYHCYKSAGQSIKGIARLLLRQLFVFAGLAAGIWESGKKPQSTGLSAEPPTGEQALSKHTGPEQTKQREAVL